MDKRDQLPDDIFVNIEQMYSLEEKLNIKLYGDPSGKIADTLEYVAARTSDIAHGLTVWLQQPSADKSYEMFSLYSGGEETVLLERRLDGDPIDNCRLYCPSVHPNIAPEIINRLSLDHAVEFAEARLQN